MQRTQEVFNAWIRKRDIEKGCISCQGPVQHAGHYFAAGSYSALRFNEMNVNGQCLRCNNFLHGNLINYRKGMVRRYGEEAVKQLELLAEIKKPHKWKEWDLEILRQQYLANND